MLICALCDGLGLSSDGCLFLHLVQVSPELPAQNVAHMAAAALVDAALARGSGDDITAVVSLLKWDNRL